MLQTLERQRKYIGVILSHKHTPKYLMEKIYNDYDNVFTSYQGSMRTFQNIILNVKWFQECSEKHCKRGDCQYENFHRITLKTSF